MLYIARLGYQLATHVWRVWPVQAAVTVLPAFAVCRISHSLLGLTGGTAFLDSLYTIPVELVLSQPAELCRSQTPGTIHPCDAVGPNCRVPLSPSHPSWLRAFGAHMTQPYLLYDCGGHQSGV